MRDVDCEEDDDYSCLKVKSLTIVYTLPVIPLFKKPKVKLERESTRVREDREKRAHIYTHTHIYTVAHVHFFHVLPCLAQKLPN